MITTGAVLIRYIQDFDPLDTDYETNTTQVNLPGGGRKYIKVALSDGSSTEFMPWKNSAPRSSRGGPIGQEPTVPIG